MLEKVGIRANDNVCPKSSFYHVGPRFPASLFHPLLDEVDVLLHPDVSVKRSHAALGIIVLADPLIGRIRNAFLPCQGKGCFK